MTNGTDTATPDTTTAPVKVGDFFRCSWGYDQTNIDFYEVLTVSKSGKTITVVQTMTGVVEDHGSSVKVAPIPGSIHHFNQKVTTRRLRLTTWGEPTWAFRVESYATAYLWDCTPASETAQGWGH